MQATARLKYLMMSPRKMRRVVSLVKGKTVDEALTILKFTNKAAAGPLAKTIQSATANALSEEGTSRIKAENLSIVRIQVDEGPRAKRIRFRAMGRVYRYKKRFTHLTVVVEGEPEEEATARKRPARKKVARETAKKVRKTKKPAAKKAATKKKAGKTTKKTVKKTTKKADDDKKPTAKKTTTKKTAAKKTTTKKTAAKKTTAKKTTTKKTSAKKSTKSAKSDKKEK